MNYAPESFTDSDDDDYGGFMFSVDYDDHGNRIRKSKPAFNKQQNDDSKIYHNFYDCIRNDDVDGIRKLLESTTKIKINDPLPNYQWTPLMLACQERKTDVVKFILHEMNGDPNGHVDKWTPLMVACSGPKDLNYDIEFSSTIDTEVLKIVEMLLDRGAFINIHNLLGETAFMFAAENGLISVVKLLIENSASIEGVDNEGRTALLYAVKGNQFEVTKMLIEAGAIIDVEDRYNNTPKSLAQFNGYEDIERLFPIDEVVVTVPSEYTNYVSYKDYVPTAFPQPDRPAYGPEVFQFMRGTKTKCVEYKFYEARISLSELLTIDDSRLQQIGIEFPFQRKRILLGLLKFHEQAWAKTSLQIPNRINNNVRECFYVYANCLRQLVTLKSSLHFIENHELFKDVEMTAPAYEYRQEINELFVSIHLKTKNLLKTLRQIEDAFNVPPPLYIDGDVIKKTLDKNTTFRMQWYRRFKMMACIGLGFAVIAVIKRSLIR